MQKSHKSYPIKMKFFDGRNRFIGPTLMFIAALLMNFAPNLVAIWLVAVFGFVGAVLTLLAGWRALTVRDASY